MRSKPWRRAGLALLLVLAGAAVTLGLLAVALDRGALRHLLVHVLSWHLERPLAVRGALQVHLLSRQPRLEADGVTLGNPPWSPPGDMGTARHLELQWHWGRGIDGLLLEGAQLTLTRDTDGFANWQFKRPEPGQLPTLAPLRSLQGTDVHLHLVDAQRRLEFDGTVSGGSVGGAPLLLQAQGTLNTRAAQLSLRGDALGAARPTANYHFEYVASGSGARVDLKGVLLKPFETDLFDASFDSSGEDLKDLYYLVGLRFPHTGPFRLSGQLERRGTLTRFQQLALASGGSDLSGSLSVETHGSRPRLDAVLHSRVLNSADLGPRATGQEPPREPPPVFSTARLSPAAMRHVDGQFRYTADRLSIGRFSLEGVTARLGLERGALDLPALDGRLLGGRVSAQLHLDATRDVPPVDVRLHLAGANLEELPLRVDRAPLSAPFDAHVQLAGHGRSVHEFVASADGSAEFHVQQGTIRASLAELAGLDLRGIGLTLARSERDARLRCAVGRFQVADGTLTTQELLIDTDSVQIHGQGQIRLGEEMLDLTLQGEPKETRLLRLRTPLLIRGPFAKPGVAAQTQGASLKLIDRGRAQDADCGAP